MDSTGALTMPAQGAIAVTPADGTDLTRPSRGVYIGGAGNIKVTMVDGTTVTVTGVVAGAMYSWRVSRIWSTNTTATGIVAFY